MTDDSDKPVGQAGVAAKKVSRQDRLKLALRENLKRRKSQARGRGEATPAPTEADGAPPYEGGAKKPG
jgi:hypothetical protein